jgi:hypothetical protein
MQSTWLKEETLDKNLSLTYNLSVAISSCGLTYCILDTIRQKIIALRHFAFDEEPTVYGLTEKISGVISEDEFLRRSYRNIRLMFADQRSTLVPASIYRPGDDKLFLEFNTLLKPAESPMACYLRSLDSWIIFPMGEGLLTLLKEKFSGVRIYHPSAPLIEDMLIRNRNKITEPVVCADFNAGYIQLAVFDGQGLLFSNAYTAREESDQLYFIMNVYETQRLNQEQAILQFSGDILPTSPLVAQVRTYLKKVRFQEPGPVYNLSVTQNNLEPHWFSNLVNLNQCE